MANKGDTEMTVRDQLRFMSLAGARSDNRMPNQTGELAGSLAKCRIFQ